MGAFTTRAFLYTDRKRSATQTVDNLTIVLRNYSFCKYIFQSNPRAHYTLISSRWDRLSANKIRLSNKYLRLSEEQDNAKETNRLSGKLHETLTYIFEFRYNVEGVRNVTRPKPVASPLILEILCSKKRNGNYDHANLKYLCN